MSLGNETNSQTVGEGLDPPLGKQSLPLGLLESMRFAKGGSRPSPTKELYDKLQFVFSMVLIWIKTFLTIPMKMPKLGIFMGIYLCGTKKIKNGL